MHYCNYTEPYGSEKVALFYGIDIVLDVYKRQDLTMVNIFTTWCSPCVNEIPDLEKLYQEMKDKGVGVVGVLSLIHILFHYALTMECALHISRVRDIVTGFPHICRKCWIFSRREQRYSFMQIQTRSVLPVRIMKKDAVLRCV